MLPSPWPKHPSQQEFAQQLAARIVQLHSFHQVWHLVRSARFSTQHVFPDEASIARAEAFVTADLMAKLFSIFDRSGTDLWRLATS
jgi:hypothetical protein